MLRSTTVLAVRRDSITAIGADGQVTLGSSSIKANAKKVRRLYSGKVVAGFAGSGADALALLERLESRLNEHGGNLLRACVELVKEWRLDKALRRLEAFMIVANAENMLLISGSGDLIEPDEPILAIGSGSEQARACAMALYRHTQMPASEIVKECLKIAAEMCIYTNDHITLEVI
ncbi:MAG: ATP-dependent protease subunit HslV [Aquificaceae bacterium]|nr:ATP-dependent protease subunit HslV [Aquificaceae bacterium]